MMPISNIFNFCFLCRRGEDQSLSDSVPLSSILIPLMIMLIVDREYILQKWNQYAVRGEYVQTNEPLEFELLFWWGFDGVIFALRSVWLSAADDTESGLFTICGIRTFECTQWLAFTRKFLIVLALRIFWWTFGWMVMLMLLVVMEGERACDLWTSPSWNLSFFDVVDCRVSGHPLSIPLHRNTTHSLSLSILLCTLILSIDFAVFNLYFFVRLFFVLSLPPSLQYISGVCQDIRSGTFWLWSLGFAAFAYAADQSMTGFVGAEKCPPEYLGTRLTVSIYARWVSRRRFSIHIRSISLCQFTCYYNCNSYGIYKIQSDIIRLSCRDDESSFEHNHIFVAIVSRPKRRYLRHERALSNNK